MLLVLSACSGKSGYVAAPPTTLAGDTPLERETGGPLRLQLTGIHDNGTKAPPAEVVGAVTWTLDRWLAEAVVAPLRTGQPVADLAALFTPAALERASTDDRSALTDEGLPALATRIHPRAATLHLSSVAGPDEATAVVVATVDLQLHVVGPMLDADVVRQGELVLVPADGGWRIDGYDLRTSRQSR